MQSIRPASGSVDGLRCEFRPQITLYTRRDEQRNNDSRPRVFRPESTGRERAHSRGLSCAGKIQAAPELRGEHRIAAPALRGAAPPGRAAEPGDSFHRFPVALPYERNPEIFRRGDIFWTYARRPARLVHEPRAPGQFISATL